MKTGVLISVIIVAIALILFGWVYLGKVETGDTEGGATEPSGVESGGALQPVEATLDEMPVEVETEDQSLIETAQLVAVGSFSGSGTATRQFDGKTFVHRVQTTLGSPAPETFYEGWLVKKTPSLTFISTGKLISNAEGFMLGFAASQDYPGYDGVVITQETLANGLDNKPEEHVLEGSF